MKEQMYAEKMIEACIREEEQLQFSHFTQTDALRLGQTLYETSREYQSPVAIEIRMNRLTVFSFYPNGTNENNRLWLQAKANTVDMLQQSSLHYWASLQLSGETPEKRRMPEEKFACCGGGFPLTIRGTGVIGTICVSGLPHQEDHRVVTEAIKRYLEQM